MARISQILAAQGQTPQQQLGLLPVLLMQSIAQMIEDREERQYRLAAERRAEAGERRAAAQEQRSQEQFAYAMERSKEIDPSTLKKALAEAGIAANQADILEATKHLQVALQEVRLKQETTAERVSAALEKPTKEKAEAEATLLTAQAKRAEEVAAAQLKEAELGIELKERQLAQTTPYKQVQDDIRKQLNMAVNILAERRPDMAMGGSDIELRATVPARAAITMALHADEDEVGGPTAKRRLVQWAISQVQGLGGGAEKAVDQLRVEGMLEKASNPDQYAESYRYLFLDEATGKELQPGDVVEVTPDMNTLSDALLHQAGRRAVDDLVETALGAYDARTIEEMREMVGEAFVQEAHRHDVQRLKSREGAEVSPEASVVGIPMGVPRTDWPEPYTRVPELSQIAPQLGPEPDAYRTVEYRAGGGQRQADLGQIQDYNILARTMRLPEKEVDRFTGELLRKHLEGARPEEIQAIYYPWLQKQIEAMFEKTRKPKTTIRGRDYD